jgi:hypothetical protein
VGWGYHKPKVGLRILYQDKARQEFVNADWKVDNFHRDGSGAWARKAGSDYYGFRLLEDERTGKVRKEKVHFFELKLAHRETNGVIWVQTFKLRPKHRDKKLDVLLRNYATSLSGSGLFVEGNVYGLLGIKVKKYAAMVREKKWIQVDGFHALQAKIDIINLDSARAGSKRPERSVDVVLLRFSRPENKYEPVPQRPGYWVKTRYHRPVILVVGYKNSAIYFEKHRPDLQAFLRQIRFKHRSGPKR